MAVSEARKRANTKWDAENMKTAGCRLTKTEHAAFRAYADARGKTISALLLEYVRSCITESTEQKEDSNGGQIRQISTKGS